MWNALLQAAQVAVTFIHLSAAPDFVLLPIERFCFLPAPMFDVAVGEGKIGAVLITSPGEMIPDPARTGLDHAETAPRRVPRMIVDEQKRLGRTWVLNT